VSGKNKLARALVKELAKGMLQEDLSLAGRVQKMIGGDPPFAFTLDVPEVLLEPFIEAQF